MSSNRCFWTGVLALSSLFVCGLSAQSKSSAAGDYAGVIGGALRVKLHLTAASDGLRTCTIESVDQGAIVFPCADFRIDGNALRFRVPRVNGMGRHRQCRWHIAYGHI